MPIQWIVCTPPIPSQLVNESRIEQIVGNQIRLPVTITGIPTIRTTAIRSAPERRTARFLFRAPPALTLAATSVAIASRLQRHDPKIAFFCFWMLLTSPLMSSDC